MENKFLVGYSKVDITPDIEAVPIGLVGNNDHRTRICTGVMHHIWANCIAFTDEDGETVILIGTDLHGTENRVVDAVRANVFKILDEDPHIHIQVGSSHNHSGPDQGYAITEGSMYYDELMIRRLTSACMEALENRKPATMEMTFFRTKGMNFLRHYLLKNGQYLGGGGTANAREKEILGFMEAPDELLQVVRFQREGEKDIALFNFQGHPHQFHSYDPEIKKQNYTLLHGSAPERVRHYLLEKADVESVYFMGGSGNSCQHSFVRSHNTYGTMEQYAETMADMIIDSFKNLKPAKTGKIFYEEQEVLFWDPVREQIRPHRLAAMGFGDFGYAAAPFEVFQSDAMAVRENSPYKFTIYNQTANGNRGTGYLPDAHALTYPCYERGPCFAAFGTGEVCKQILTSMLNNLHKQSGQEIPEKETGYITDRTPKCDGVTYVLSQNPNPRMTYNNFAFVNIIKDGEETELLVSDLETAQAIAEKKETKLLFDGRNVCVGIAE